MTRVLLVFLISIIMIPLASCGSTSAVPVSSVCEKMLECDINGETSLAECEAQLEANRSVMRVSSWNAFANCLIGMSCEQLASEEGINICLQAAMDAAPKNAADGFLEIYCERAIDCGQLGGSTRDCVDLLKAQAGEYLGAYGMFNNSLLGCLEDCTRDLPCEQLNNFFEVCGLQCELPFVNIDLDCENGWQEDDVCVCDEGWAGDFCDVCADGYYPDGWDCVGRCEPDTCSGHGICSDDYGNIYCSCDYGYAGEHCEACADGYLEVDGRCRPTGGCTVDGADCDDGFLCTSDDICSQGVCIGVDLTCDDGLACSLDSCMEIQGGCIHEPVPTGGPEGYLGDPVCSNGLDDDCDGLTDDEDEDCLTTPCSVDGDCADDGNPCTTATCVAGLCRWLPVPEASPCPGSSECASSFICRSGVCMPGMSDLDADGDGFVDGNCAYGFDCDDNDPNINQGAEGPRGAPSCTDGIDNDCDGLVDAYDSSCWVDNCTPEGWCAQRPKIGAENLAAVWAFGPDDVWATGGMETILHWDGTGWQRELSPSYWAIYDLCGCEPDDAWAATQTGDIMRYDGVSWAQFPSPNDPHILYGLHCQCDNAPTDDVWAVGRVGEVIHWDGIEWSVVAIPDISDLNGVWASGPGDMWAVGRSGAMLHYANNAGQVVSSGTVEDLHSIWGRSATDIWAVGENGAILHYDGSVWNDETFNGAGDLNEIHGLADGSGPWIVGGSWRSGTVLGWNGSAWVHDDLFGSDPPQLNALHGVAADDMWAVGDSGAIIHWDGVEAIDLIKPTGNMSAICAWEEADGSTLAYAVGSNAEQTLEWNGADWRINQATLDTIMVDIWCAGPYGTWTINQYGETQRWGASLNESTGELDLPITQYIEAFAGRVVDDQAEIWAVGDDGLLVHMLQGEWTIDHVSMGSRSLLDVWFASDPSALDAVAVGEDGNLATYEQNVWTLQEPLTGENLNAVWGDGQGTVWVVGNQGTVLKWNGSSFVLETVPADSEDLSDVSGTGPDDVWVTARDRVLHWDGQSWTSELLSNGYDRQLAVTASHIWIVDRNGSILHKAR